MSKLEFYNIVISDTELEVVRNALLFFENEFQMDGVMKESPEDKQYGIVVATRKFFDNIGDKDKC